MAYFRNFVEAGPRSVQPSSTLMPLPWRRQLVNFQHISDGAFLVCSVPSCDACDALSFCSGCDSRGFRPSEEGADEAQGGTLRPPGEDVRAQMKHR